MRGDFSGADDDWLDDVDGKPRPKASAKKPLQDRAQVLPYEAGNGTIIEIFPNQALVRLDGVEKARLCGYRMATLAARGAARERSPVCVGDRVVVEAGVVVNRCERRNALTRSAPNARNPLVHAIVANIDLLLVVASARQPDFTPGIVDRFLAAAAERKISAALCVNKLDLLEPSAARPWNDYKVPVVECCAKSGEGAAKLKALVRGRTVAFCGHSGVGKTSIIRALLGDAAFGKVGDVSAASGKGRHTTTGAILTALPDGSAWIDTPGIMNFTAA